MELSKIVSSMLKHKIVIERIVSGQDEDNIPLKDNWEVLYSCKSFIEDTSLQIASTEFTGANGIASKETKNFYIRNIKRYNVNNLDRIKYKNKIYNILTVKDLEHKGRILEIKGEIIS